jgi:alpha-glucosidase
MRCPPPPFKKRRSYRQAPRWYLKVAMVVYRECLRHNLTAVVWRFILMLLCAVVLLGQTSFMRVVSRLQLSVTSICAECEQRHQHAALLGDVLAGGSRVIGESNDAMAGVIALQATTGAAVANHSPAASLPILAGGGPALVTGHPASPEGIFRGADQAEPVAITESAQQPLGQIVAVSPDGRLRFTFYLDPGPTFTVTRAGSTIIFPSAMRIFGDEDAHDFRIVFHNATAQPFLSTWFNAWGERSSVPDNYNEVVIGLATARPNADGATVASELHIQVRAYDEGVAFRFEVPDHAQETAFQWEKVQNEEVEFNLPPDTYSYWTRAAQKPYMKMRVANWTQPCEPPLTLELADGQWVSLLEAAQVNFPRMRYKLGSGPDRLVTSLHERFRIDSAPFKMPWRVIMVADKPGRLLENNYLVLNLNKPNAIEGDTTWIKPGRVMRMMSYYNEAAMQQIAFALAQNLTYIHLDAGWYGNEYDPASDATTWNASRIDLPAIIKYAKSKGVGVILYVNHLALERQMDELFPLYGKWGVDGVKFGFVNVGPQNWTIWLHDAIRKAAEHKLIVDVHDDYRPTGFSRTFPHLLQVEGIYGDEGFPSANQSTIYPFTRFVAGHADHTYCFMDRRLTKTKAHQLALTVINFGPLQYLHWYDVPKQYSLAEIEEIEFWKDLPTVWDDTKVIDGVPGEYIAVARRSSTGWWVGIVTNESAREFTLSLAFLVGGGSVGADGGSGGEYEVRIHEDAEPQTIAKRTMLVSPSDEDIALSLRASGGVALRFRSVAGR